MLAHVTQPEIPGPGHDPGILHSLAWNAAAKSITQILSWGCSLVIARILVPADFGIIAMTSVAFGLLSLLSEFGAGAAVLNIRALTTAQIRQMNCASAISGVIGCLALSACSPAIASFYRQPALRYAVPLVAIGLIISGFRAIPNALIQRSLSFRRLSTIEIAQSGAQSVAALTLAYLGFRYWSIILSGLIAAAIGTALTIATLNPGFERPRFPDLRNVLSFGGAVLTQNLSWYAYSNADFVIAGRVLGGNALGAYSLAWNLAMVPTEKISSLVMRVTPGYFSKHQVDLAALRNYLRNLTTAISAVVFPAAIGAALVAPELVPPLLGAKWIPAIRPLILLSLFMAMGSLVPLMPQILNAVGQPGHGTRNALLKLALLRRHSMQVVSMAPRELPPHGWSFIR
jgi:O-antigen/teichoic acid export membrane protein